MSYDDDFYTDEPIGLDHDDGYDDRSGGNWDYVADSGGRTEMSWDDASPADGDSDTPEDIRLLQAMIRRDYWAITNNKSFYEQALLMAGYEDEAPVVPFNTFFPTYRLMTVPQLRSYFTIRKLLRQGKHPDVPLSYLFVYAYETLMQIGVATAEEGYEVLCDLRDSYPDMNPTKRPYMTEWLRDYVVWYGLSDHYAECFDRERHDDDARDTLRHYATASDDRLFAIVDSCGRNRVSKGVLYKKMPETAVAAVASVVRQVIPVLEKQYGHHIDTLCLGKRKMQQHVMFTGAVFYAKEPVREADVAVSQFHHYACRNGLWSVTGEAYPPVVTAAMLGEMLHDIDALLRQRLGVKPLIKSMALSPGSPIASVLPKAVDAWLAEWKEQESLRKAEARRKAVEKARQDVSIDLSQLSRIRKDADVVRDALIVGEEGDNIALPTNEPTVPTMPNRPDTPTMPDRPVEPTAPGKPAASSPEATFISLLLNGGDYNAYLRETHTPAGVMVENINSRAMDVLGDIVLEDDGQQITVIDDYRDDIKQLYD